MPKHDFVVIPGRPFGTVAALMCLIATLALIVLGRVAVEIVGTSSPLLLGDPAAVQPYWGLLLAAEIVKVVLGSLVLLTVWTVAGPVSPGSPRNAAALAVGTIGAVLLIVAGRQQIVAAGELSGGVIAPFGRLVALGETAAIACIGIWAAMLALEARRAGSLPGWVQAAGLLFGATALISVTCPPLVPVAALVALAWFAGLFATLRRPARWA